MNPSSTLLFLHIPKTAGVTVMRLFWRKQIGRHPPSWLRPKRALGFAGQGNHDVRLDRVEALSDRQQRQVRLFHGHFGYGAHERFRTPTSYFTVLRDPAKRLLSTHRYLIQLGEIPPDTTLEALVGSKNSHDSKFATDNGHVRYLAGENGHPITEGQVTQTMADVACERLERDFPVVGTTERLEESLLLLAEHWGWKTVPFSTYNITRSSSPSAPDDGSKAAQDALLEEANVFDRQVYNLAVARLDKAVADFGRMPERIEAHRKNCRKYDRQVIFIDRLNRTVGRLLPR